jgi:hypothetical protein
MKRLFLIVSLLACPSAVLAAPKQHSASKGAATRAPTKPAVYYDFKGARLGMSLAEWRALPITATGLNIPGSPIQGGAVQAVCTGDPGSDSAILSFRSSAEQKANVTACGYAYPETIGTYTSWRPASVPIGEMAASDVEYKFLDGSLYEISISGNSALLDEVMSGLRAKWGDPTTVVNDTTQNKAGATFPHTVKTWVNSVALIRVETPFSRIDDLNVSYSTATGLAKITAIEKGMNPDINKM